LFIKAENRKVLATRVLLFKHQNLILTNSGMKVLDSFSKITGPRLEINQNAQVCSYDSSKWANQSCLMTRTVARSPSAPRLRHVGVKITRKFLKELFRKSRLKVAKRCQRVALFKHQNLILTNSGMKVLDSFSKITGPRLEINQNAQVCSYDSSKWANQSCLMTRTVARSPSAPRLRHVGVKITRKFLKELFRKSRLKVNTRERNYILFKK
jgi:hypothetical protein